MKLYDLETIETVWAAEFSGFASAPPCGGGGDSRMTPMDGEMNSTLRWKDACATPARITQFVLPGFLLESEACSRGFHIYVSP